MNYNPRILVVGAGASGLAFALECASQGIRVRIIDKRPVRTMAEKATGVAAGVWNQLSRFGISPKTVDTAIPMSYFAFYDDQQLIANVPVPKINGDPPAHLYPQGALEQHLEKALSSEDVLVDYDTEFVSCEESAESIDVRIRYNNGGPESVDSFDWLIGADGAHSRVREAIKVPFLGRNYPENWSVAEVATNQWPSRAQAQLFLQSNGVGLFLSQPAVGLVQGILNAENVVEQLQAKFTDAKLRYARPFSVALKRVPSPRSGRSWLIGDAAHVQSPVGGQGLNLAIWDGITLAKGLLAGDCNIEKVLAKRARNVLFFTDFDYRMLATKSPVLRFARNKYWAYAAKHPAVAKWFFRIISGVW